MKLRNLRALFFLSYLISITLSAKSETELIIGYGDHNAEPYAIEKAEQLYDGIIKDIVTEISGELDVSVVFVKTPRKRIERYLENNTIHLVLIQSPKWLNNSEKLQWSETVFIEKERMVVKANNPDQYQKLLDFKGMVIGTIRGYIYPVLQPFFDREYFIRYDVSNLNVNFLRLKLDRIDALIDAEVLINYHLKQNKNANDFKVLPLTMSEQNIQAALSPEAPISITEFNAALKKLKDQGVIAAIFEKYQAKK